MEKIKIAANKLDNVNYKISILKSGIQVLWDSMANGDLHDILVYADFLYDLNEKAEMLETEHKELIDLLFNGIREVQA